MNKLFLLSIPIFLLVVFTFSFVNAEQSLLIPAWIKTNAGWWADDLISDADFVVGIQYLLDNDVLQISDRQDKIPSLVLVTDKSEYSQGEDVKITLKNIGTEILLFQTDRYGLRIFGTHDNVTVCCIATDTRVDLKPGEQTILVWPQTNGNDASPIFPGSYTINVKYDSAFYHNAFTITHRILIV